MVFDTRHQPITPHFMKDFSFFKGKPNDGGRPDLAQRRRQRCNPSLGISHFNSGAKINNGNLFQGKAERPTKGKQNPPGQSLTKRN